jgi:hypothetical protein
MRNILKNRTALSTVVTTLIILVVSVLLAGVVTYFAINITSTRVQEENLSMSLQHIWVTGAGASEAAVQITNTGGRDVVISKIAVRGQAADMATTGYYAIAGSTDPLTTDLVYVASADLVGNTTYGGTRATLAAVTGTLVLKSGATMVVYVTSPDSVSVNDIGLTVAITVFTSQAIYYKETNVNAA